MAATRAAASRCRACHLWTIATQTVFGQGKPTATMMLVGEQPGDQEDRQGKPFVGPAGALLDEALEAAGINRAQVYLTNVVKHFKSERGDKSARRIHKKPNAAEITACRPWLDAETALVKPQVVVALGATAAQALLGKSFRVTKDHGKVLARAGAPPVVATVHPASVLRAPDAEARKAAREGLIADLKVAARAAKRARRD